MGLSETRLGKALAGLPRSSFLLSSKVGFLVRKGKRVTDYSRKGVETSIRESLERLAMERLDIALLHDVDGHLDEVNHSAFPYLLEQREKGALRAIGAGMNNWQTPLKMLDQADLDCFLIAGRYTLLDQSGLPLLEECRKRGVAVLLGGVYNTGILATGAVEGALYQYRPANAEILKKVQDLESCCAGYGVPLPAAALQFAFAHPSVATLVLGLETVSEVNQAFAWLHHPIPHDLWLELVERKLLPPTVPLPG